MAKPASRLQAGDVLEMERLRGQIEWLNKVDDLMCCIKIVGHKYPIYLSSYQPVNVAGQ